MFSEIVCDIEFALLMQQGETFFATAVCLTSANVKKDAQFTRLKMC